jgi:hypothetical protein
MVARTSFFVASLWAPLPLVAMMVLACLWMMMFPKTVDFEAGRDAAGVGLIAVPFVYTMLFGATYFTARALHALHLLSLWALLAVGAIVSGAAAGIFWASDLVEHNLLLLTAIIFGGSLLGLASTALVWWVVGVRTPALVPSYERRRSSSRSRRSRDGANVGVIVADPQAPKREVVSDELIVRWDANLRRLQIVHPDRSRYPVPLAEFDQETLAAEDAPLIGEALIRLMPSLRSRYRTAAGEDDDDATERRS